MIFGKKTPKLNPPPNHYPCKLFAGDTLNIDVVKNYSVKMTEDKLFHSLNEAIDYVKGLMEA
jgi:hypothetical protein